MLFWASSVCACNSAALIRTCQALRSTPISALAHSIAAISRLCAATCSSNSACSAVRCSRTALSAASSVCTSAFNCARSLIAFSMVSLFFSRSGSNAAICSLRASRLSLSFDIGDNSCTLLPLMGVHLIPSWVGNASLGYRIGADQSGGRCTRNFETQLRVNRYRDLPPASAHPPRAALERTCRYPHSVPKEQVQQDERQR